MNKCIDCGHIISTPDLCDLCEAPSHGECLKRLEQIKIHGIFACADCFFEGSL